MGCKLGRVSKRTETVDDADGRHQVVKNPQVDALHSIIRSRIVDGEYGEGNRFPSWRELASEAGVGLATVRQAFVQLEKEGLVAWDGARAVVAFPGKGAVQQPARAADIEQSTMPETWEAPEGVHRGVSESVHGLLADVLRLVVDSLSVGLAFLSRIDGQTLVIEGVDDRAGMGVRRGDIIPLCDSYCTTMLETAASSLVVPDARNDPLFAPRITTRTLGIGAYAGIPLYRADGTLFGTLCTLHPTARAIESSELSLLALAGKLIMQTVDAEEGQERRIQERISSATDAVADVVLAVEYDGRIKFWNRAARSLMTLDDAEPVAPYVFEIIALRDHLRMSNHMHAVIEGQNCRPDEYHVIGSDSQQYVAAIAISGLEGDAGKLLAFTWRTRATDPSP